MTPSSNKKTNEAFHIRHRNLFVGTFLLIPLVGTLLFLVISLSKINLFEKWYPIWVTYDSNPGLKEGGLVTIQGFPIGFVKQLDLDSMGFVHVNLQLKQRYSFLVKKDSKALPIQEGFVGDWKVVLSKGSGGAALAVAGDTLMADVPVKIEQIIAQGMATVDMIQKILQPITEGRGTVGKLLMEDTLYQDLRKIMRDAQGLLAGTGRTLRGADSLVATYTHLGATVGGSVGLLLDSINMMNRNLNTMLLDIDRVVKSSEPLTADLQKTMAGVQRDLKETETLLRAVQKHWLIRKQVKQVEEDSAKK